MTTIQCSQFTLVKLILLNYTALARSWDYTKFHNSLILDIETSFQSIYKSSKIVWWMNKAFNLFFLLREMEYFNKIIQSTNEKSEKSRAKTRVFHLFLFHFLHFTLGFRFQEQRMNVYCRLCFPRRLWWCEDVRSNKHRVQAWAGIWIEYCEMRNIEMQEKVGKGWDLSSNSISHLLVIPLSVYLPRPMPTPFGFHDGPTPLNCIVVNWPNPSDIRFAVVMVSRFDRTQLGRWLSGSSSNFGI